MQPRSGAVVLNRFWQSYSGYIQYLSNDGTNVWQWKFVSEYSMHVDNGELSAIRRRCCCGGVRNVGFLKFPDYTSPWFISDLTIVQSLHSYERKNRYISLFTRKASQNFRSPLQNFHRNIKPRPEIKAFQNGQKGYCKCLLRMKESWESLEWSQERVSWPGSVWRIKQNIECVKRNPLGRSRFLSKIVWNNFKYFFFAWRNKMLFIYLI